MVIRAALFVVFVAGCGSRPAALRTANTAGAAGEVTLYRDRALVRQRVELEITPSPGQAGGRATIRLRVGAGIGPDDIYIVERDRFTIGEIRVIRETGDTPAIEEAPAPDPAENDGVDDELVEPAPGGVEPAPAPPAEPRDLEIVIGAPRAGKFVLHVGYLTSRISWEVAYTMTTTTARDHAVLRGAIAIRNATGIELRGVTARVVDAEIGSSTHSAAELLASTHVGAEPRTTPAAIARDLGRVDLIDGETRIELLAGAKPRRMRSVLVYDPIGTTLDSNSATPVRDPRLGASPASTRVTESCEVDRDGRASRGLPAGPVRLLEHRRDGSLAVLGESRLFEASTSVAEVDTIAVGTAEGVTGHRERYEFTLDERHRRLVEEFVLTIENERATPVEVLLREHLYRGLNWVVPYPLLGEDAKEGPQQIVIRKRVPARGKAKVHYVVVYTWVP